MIKVLTEMKKSLDIGNKDYDKKILIIDKKIQEIKLMKIKKYQ